MINCLIDRINNSHCTINTIQWNIIVFISFIIKWILLSNPSCIYRIHVNIVIFSELFTTCTGYHVKGCFCHVCVRMSLLFTFTVKDSLHWGYVDDEGWNELVTFWWVLFIEVFIYLFIVLVLLLLFVFLLLLFALLFMLLFIFIIIYFTFFH